MRTRAAITLAALASLAASAAGAAPYPASGLVTGVSWDTATYRSAGAGGDAGPSPRAPTARSIPPGATARSPAR